MKTYVGSSTGLSKRLGRVGKTVGKVVGKVFRGCGSFSLVVPETTVDAFLCVVGDRMGFVGKVVRGSLIPRPEVATWGKPGKRAISLFGRFSIKNFHCVLHNTIIQIAV